MARVSAAVDTRAPSSSLPSSRNASRRSSEGVSRTSPRTLLKLLTEVGDSSCVAGWIGESPRGCRAAPVDAFERASGYVSVRAGVSWGYRAHQEELTCQISVCELHHWHAQGGGGTREAQDSNEQFWLSSRRRARVTTRELSSLGPAGASYVEYTVLIAAASNASPDRTRLDEIERVEPVPTRLDASSYSYVVLADTMHSCVLCLNLMGPIPSLILGQSRSRRSKLLSLFFLPHRPCSDSSRHSKLAATRGQS